MKILLSICMSYYLFWINSKWNFLSSSVIEMLIDSLVLSCLDYALPVWGPPLTQVSTVACKDLRIGELTLQNHYVNMITFLTISEPTDSVPLYYASSLSW